MNFFKSQDINRLYEEMPDNCNWYEYLTNKLNIKLANTGDVVNGFKGEFGAFVWSDCKDRRDTHKALLINIEPIEKCKHLKEEVQLHTHDTHSGLREQWFQCKCGVRVQPKEFEEVK